MAKCHNYNVFYSNEQLPFSLCYKYGFSVNSGHNTVGSDGLEVLVCLDRPGLTDTDTEIKHAHFN